ncbi:hypothetical protein BFP70_02605 [Thioclava sp. SK-1]|nr:hypothetical protein BFP70_02605 [Thioclava sp. SK-1]
MEAVLGGCTDPGPKPRNDDAIAGRIPESRYEMHAKGVVACIADGISTGRNSHLAAQLSVTQFAQDYYSAPESWPVQDCTARLLSSLNSWFFAQNRSGSPQADGQVTTFTALIARSTTAHIVHIGDTRCLRLRDGVITGLTEDHNAAFMGQEQALTRALGIEPNIRVDYRSERLAQDDIYLLMSDGVHGVLSYSTMAAMLRDRAMTTQNDLEAASRALCDAALAAGSDDNLSCLMVRITALPSETLTEAHHRLTDQAIPPVMKPGNKIDGFEIEQVMYSSTRSHVYRVRRAGEDTRYVLKAPSRNFADNMQYLEGFTLEQWVGRRIDNPQVMKILPHEDSRFLYYISELVEGETLREWMARHPTPSIRQVLPILGSIISAVRIFHRLGMVHRDLKPENIMLNTDGVAKIIDFGSVQVSGFADIMTGLGDHVPEGSLNYIAPEVLTGRGASPSSDLFSIGAITYEMLTGRVPFALEDGRKLPGAAADWALTSLTDLRHDLPEASAEALARVLSYEPKNRPEVMSEFLADLRKSMDQGVLPRDHIPLLQRGSVSFWRGWAMISSAIALALLIALLLR